LENLVSFPIWCLSNMGSISWAGKRFCIFSDMDLDSLTSGPRGWAGFITLKALPKIESELIRVTRARCNSVISRIAYRRYDGVFWDFRSLAWPVISAGQLEGWCGFSIPLGRSNTELELHSAKVERHLKRPTDDVANMMQKLVATGEELDTVSFYARLKLLEKARKQLIGEF